MKKIVSFSFVLLANFSLFCQGISGAKKIIENFFNKGTFIRIEYSNESFSYLYKNSVFGISYEKSKYNLQIADFEHGMVFDIKHWSVQSDDAGNIIISRR